jgi:transcriptional regulator with XRE-family HTH domain
MDIRRQVGRKVAALRGQADLSQEELADRCGLHRTYLSGVERGVRNPTIMVLAKIAKALKVPPSRLLEAVSKHEGSGSA